MTKTTVALKKAFLQAIIVPAITLTIGMGLLSQNAIAQQSQNDIPTDKIQKNDIQTLIQEDKVYSASDVTTKPEFPGGINGFYKAIFKKFKMPNTDENFATKIYVSYVIEKDGSMTNIKVLSDPGYGLGNEAVRVLKSITQKWNPGKIDEAVVRTLYNLPITINVKN